LYLALLRAKALLIGADLDGFLHYLRDHFCRVTDADLETTPYIDDLSYRRIAFGHSYETRHGVIDVVKVSRRVKRTETNCADTGGNLSDDRWNNSPSRLARPVR